MPLRPNYEFLSSNVVVAVDILILTNISSVNILTLSYISSGVRGIAAVDIGSFSAIDSGVRGIVAVNILVLTNISSSLRGVATIDILIPINIYATIAVIVVAIGGIITVGITNFGSNSPE